MSAFRVIGTGFAVVGLAACGSSPSSSIRPATPSPSLVATASPSSVPVTTLPTPSPTSRPTPPPAPPLALSLAVFSDSSGNVELVNNRGVVIKKFSLVQIQKLSGTDNTVVATAGPNILLENYVGGFNDDTTPTTVVVISRSGTVLGRGVGTVPNGITMVGSPDGTQWAWLEQLGTNAKGQAFGALELGGISAPNRDLFNWVAPKGYSEEMNYWTNAGIILQRMSNSQLDCQGWDPGDAAFAINPKTGSISNLFSGNDQFVIAAQGVRVSASFADAYVAYVNGMIFSELAEMVGGSASPNGLQLALYRDAPSPICGNGTVTPSVEMINLELQDPTIPGAVYRVHVDLTNVTGIAWMDNTELIGSPVDGGSWLYSLDGKKGKELASPAWGFVGVLPG